MCRAKQLEDKGVTRIKVSMRGKLSAGMVPITSSFKRFD